MILLGTIGHRGPSSLVFELDRSKERHEIILQILRVMIEDFSYDIIATAFGVTKPGLAKLAKGEVAPEHSGLYHVLELCCASVVAARWQVRTNLWLPDRLKAQILRRFEELTQGVELPFRL